MKYTKLTDYLKLVLNESSNHTINVGQPEIIASTPFSIALVKVSQLISEAKSKEDSGEKITIPEDMKLLYSAFEGVPERVRGWIVRDLISKLKLDPLPSDNPEFMPLSEELEEIFRIAIDMARVKKYGPDYPKDSEIVLGIDELFFAMFLYEDDYEQEGLTEIIAMLKDKNINLSNFVPTENSVEDKKTPFRRRKVEAIEPSAVESNNPKEDPDFLETLKRVAEKAKEELESGSDIEDEDDDDSERDLITDEEKNKGKEESEETYEQSGHRSAINSKATNPNSKTPALDKFAINMTKDAKNSVFDPVVGRDKEINQIIEILSCRKKNNAVLTGDPGCGKTAIIESLAMRIAAGEVPIDLRDKQIFSLDLNSLVAGTQYRGQFEQRLQEVIKEVTTNKNIIIFIDELHNLIGSGSSSGNGDAANILKPYLARGEFQCIGSTTTDEYRKFIEKDGALKRRFSPVLVEEPTIEETIKILHGLKSVYGNYHKVTYSDEVIEKCVRWSGKYINDRFFPDKAISVLDMASSLAKLSGEVNINTTEVSKIEKRLEEVKEEKKKAILDSRFEDATVLRDEGAELEKRLEEERYKLTEGRELVEVTLDHISSVISKISNVPIDNIMSSDIEKIRSMKSELEKKIIGQDEAVRELTLALQRNMFGLRDPNKPIASFLLVGSTGVGKTLISKLVAKEFMGSESNLITIACSEYMQDWAESKLLGSAPGYVGYTDSEPRLYILKRKPYSVILIDEVEKSSSNLYNIWLNMLEEGEITLSSGEKVSCRNSIIIFTGNVGTKTLELRGNGIGFSKPDATQKRKQEVATVMAEVKKEFRPEFLNRISKVVVFNSLTEKELGQIFYLELGKVKDRIKENQGFNLYVSDKVKDLIVSKCELQYGARGLQRLITEYIEDNINLAMLHEDITGKNDIYLDVSKEDSEGIEVVFR